MFNKDNKFKLNTGSKPEKKLKKEKAPKEKKEGGKLSFGGSFGKTSGGKLSDTTKKEKKSLSFGSSNGGKFGSKIKDRFPWLKWWHIVIAAVVLVAIIVGIVLAITTSNKNKIDVDDLPPQPETEGIITTVGTFNSTEEYILCEYREYFSGKTVVVAQNESDMRHGYKPYWVFITQDGQPSSTYCKTLPDGMTPEQIKSEVLNMMSNAAGYTPEIIAKCDVHVYQPVSFTKVKLSSVTLTSDNNVTVKYQAGAVDGELSAEYTLNGTYTKNENNFTFNYTNLPEDADLRYIAENVLKSAKYDYYDSYGSWMNTLTFGDKLTLSFTTDVE